MSSVILSLIAKAAVDAGAPVLTSLLRDRIGGVAGELGSSIIETVAAKAGVPSPQLENLPDADLQKAVCAAEADAPALLDRYLASQQEANRLMLAEMKKDSAFGWLWRPAGMWLFLACIAWYVILLPALQILTGVKIETPVDFGSFTGVFVTYIGLYMGGHTVKAFRK